jgi:hypothetical protein
MSTVMTAVEIGEAWLGFVTETFELQDGCIRPDVEEEFQSLESTNAIDGQRPLWRNYTDELIDKILRCPPELRTRLLDGTDRRSLAYVQDRIQAGTELLTALAHKGLQLNLENGADSLPEYFRHLLLQDEV